MKQFLIVIMLIGQALSCYANTLSDTTKTIQLRIKNNSKYHIVKMTILNNQIEHLKPGQKSNYFSLIPFYPSMKVDVTFVKKGEIKTAPWIHIITYPIDNVGETIIEKNRNTLNIELVEGESPGEFEINTWVKK